MFDVDFCCSCLCLQLLLYIHACAHQQANRYKLLRYWVQSFIAGVPWVVVGFRTRMGVLQRVERLETLRIPEMTYRWVRIRCCCAPHTKHISLGFQRMNFCFLTCEGRKHVPHLCGPRPPVPEGKRTYRERETRTPLWPAFYARHPLERTRASAYDCSIYTAPSSLNDSGTCTRPFPVPFCTNLRLLLVSIFVAREISSTQSLPPRFGPHAVVTHPVTQKNLSGSSSSFTSTSSSTHPITVHEKRKRPDFLPSSVLSSAPVPPPPSAEYPSSPLPSKQQRSA
jgi:hypothetical protein